MAGLWAVRLEDRIIHRFFFVNTWITFVIFVSLR